MTELWDRNGKRLPQHLWEFLFECRNYRTVAQDAVVSTVDTSQGLDVSTIWRGYDHNAPSVGLTTQPTPALIYETAVLKGDLYQNRQIIKAWAGATEADARRLHDEAVRWTCDQLDTPVVIRVPAIPPRPRTGWTVPPTRERGQCQACRRLILVTAGGTLILHGQYVEYPHPRCRGSRLRPALTRH